MATTGATGNQGSTGDQDPEPQQEILDTADGIRAPATAKAGDAGRRLVQEYTARDQADQGPAPVPVQVNRGRAHQAAETGQGGGSGGQYEDRQARNSAYDAGSTRARSAGSRPSKWTWTDCLISTRTTPSTPLRCLSGNRALASITPSRRRRLSWLSPRLPTALAIKAGTPRMKRRSYAGQGPFTQRSETPRLRKRHEEWALGVGRSSGSAGASDLISSSLS